MQFLTSAADRWQQIRRFAWPPKPPVPVRSWLRRSLVTAGQTRRQCIDARIQSTRCEPVPDFVCKGTKQLGIELVEANAGNTSEVPEAFRSVLARDVEAVWIGGDTVA